MALKTLSGIAKSRYISASNSVKEPRGAVFESIVLNTISRRERIHRAYLDNCCQQPDLVRSIPLVGSYRICSPFTGSSIQVRRLIFLLISIFTVQ